MCLAVPGKVVQWLDRDPVFARAEVEFEGVRRVCHMACVTDAVEGEFVLVHAGVAISLIDAGEAARLLSDLAHLLEVENEFEASPPVEEFESQAAEPVP